MNIRELELPKHEDTEKGEVISEDRKQNGFKQEGEDGQYDDDMGAEENEGGGENENRVHLSEQMQHFISTNAF